MEVGASETGGGRVLALVCDPERRPVSGQLGSVAMLRARERMDDCFVEAFPVDSLGVRVELVRELLGALLRARAARRSALS